MKTAFIFHPFLGKVESLESIINRGVSEESATLYPYILIILFHFILIILLYSSISLKSIFYRFFYETFRI